MLQNLPCAPDPSITDLTNLYNAIRKYLVPIYNGETDEIYNETKQRLLEMASQNGNGIIPIVISHIEKIPKMRETETQTETQ